MGASVGLPTQWALLVERPLSEGRVWWSAPCATVVVPPCERLRLLKAVGLKVAVEGPWRAAGALRPGAWPRIVGLPLATALVWQAPSIWSKLECRRVAVAGPLTCACSAVAPRDVEATEGPSTAAGTHKAAPSNAWHYLKRLSAAPLPAVVQQQTRHGQQRRLLSTVLPRHAPSPSGTRPCRQTRNLKGNTHSMTG